MHRAYQKSARSKEVRLFTISDKIKVVLMDMMMPVMDGRTSIQAIRNINPEIKIIATSGLAEKLLRTVHEVLRAK